MTFSTYETSRYSGEPVLLYEFIYGDEVGDVHRFTDAERTVRLGGVDYEPTPIRHSRITGTTTYQKREIEVVVDEANPVAHLFDVYPPDKTVRLTIRKVHLSDPDQETSLVAVAVVAGVEFSGDGEASIRCRAGNLNDRQAGLQETYQLTCRVPLYSGKCGASLAAASHTVTVLSVASHSVTLAAGWENGQLPGKYIGGMLTWTVGANTRSRTILRKSGNTLYLSGVPVQLTAGATATLALGCNHHMSDCENLHNNINNFRGCPWIPKSNPVNTNPFY